VAPWPRFLLRRLGNLAAILAALVVVSFLMVRLIPGDPVRRIAGIDATAEYIVAARASLGLDRSLPEQFAAYVNDLAHGRLGTSFVDQEPVAQIVRERLPFTLALAGAALAFVAVVGFTLGLACAIAARDGRRAWLEHGFTGITGMAGAAPELIAAIVLAYVFAVTLRWLPVSGAGSATSVILPALAIGIRPALNLARVVRVEASNVLRSDYIRTAPSKRLPAWLIYGRHMAPNVATAALTIAGIAVSVPDRRHGGGGERVRLAGPRHLGRACGDHRRLSGDPGPGAAARVDRRADEHHRRRAARHLRSALAGRDRMRQAGAGVAGYIALAAASLLLLVAIIGPPLFGSAADAMDFDAAAAGISAAHWLGTDSLGRDILARTLVATRLSLGLALAATAITLVFAIPLGAALAVSGPRMRNVGARVIDAWLAFPAILLAIVVTTIIGPSVEGAVLAIGIAGVPGVARLTYTLAASAAGRDYVQSARALGVRPWRIVARHVLPNIGDTLAVTAATSLGIAIVSIASLSFLGLGVNPPLVDWGRMLVEGAQTIYVTPAAALGPAGAIALAGMAFGFSGETVGTVINPLRRRARNVRAAPVVDGAAVGVAASAPAADAVLAVDGLEVWFPDGRGGRLPAVRGGARPAARHRARHDLRV
jgi:ABC-type dipeptide/oligopeptide/nickel transport system permease subunit